MKRLFKVFILLFIFVPMFAYAEMYRVDDSVSIEFNDEWYVFTRDNYIGNKDLASFNISEEKMKSLFETNYLYVDAVYKNDFKREFFVRKKAVPSTKALKDYSESELKAFGNSLVSQLPTDEWDVYKKGDNLYIKVNFADTLEGQQAYMEQYITLYDGQAYYYSIQTTGRVLTEKDKEFLKETVDNLKYSSDKDKKEEKKETTKEEKEETKEKNDDKKDYLVFGIIAIGIICITAIIITLIIQSNKKQN